MRLDDFEEGCSDDGMAAGVEVVVEEVVMVTSEAGGHIEGGEEGLLAQGGYWALVSGCLAGLEGEHVTYWRSAALRARAKDSAISPAMRQQLSLCLKRLAGSRLSVHRSELSAALRRR